MGGGPSGLGMDDGEDDWAVTDARATEPAVEPTADRRAARRGARGRARTCSALVADISRDFARASCCAAYSSRVYSSASGSQRKSAMSAWTSSSAAARPAPRSPTGQCRSHLTTSSVT